MTILDLPTSPTLLMASLASFRLAYLFAKESGPMFVFWRIRKEAKKQKGSVAEGAQCPYCVGLWASILIVTYLLQPYRFLLADSVVLVLAVAGMQMLWYQIFTWLRRE